MEIQKFLIGDQNKPLLKRFSKIQGFNKHMRDIQKIAEPETWSTDEKDNNVLYDYLFCVFELAAKQELIYFNESATNAIFNTGLLTLNGQDIMGLFEKDEKMEYGYHWKFIGFFKDSAREILNVINKFPEFIKVFDKPEDAYYDSNLELRRELDHIIDDNFDRLPENLKTMDIETLRHVIDGSINISLKRVKRNNRLVAPQLYFGKLAYLLPIDLMGVKYALAVEKINNQYRANTILTISMAYGKARLAMKPETNWLIP